MHHALLYLPMYVCLTFAALGKDVRMSIICTSVFQLKEVAE